MTLKICGVILGGEFNDVNTTIKSAENAGADLLELRMDYIKKPLNLPDVKKLTKLPLIGTCRIKSEGGASDRSEDKRIDMLFSAASAGFDFIDVEFSTKNILPVIKKIRQSGSTPIISYHNFNSTPSLSGLEKKFSEMLETGADIYKIIPTAEEWKDNLTCLRFVENASRHRKVISFCMGKYGILSRFMSPLFGGLFTYASIHQEAKSAEGQLTIEEMRKTYRLMGVK